MYDTAPTNEGRRTYIKAMMLYLQAAYKDINGVDMPDVEKWAFVPCCKGPKNNAPRQTVEGDNCGVYACLIMEMLINKIDPRKLNMYKTQVEERA